MSRRADILVAVYEAERLHKQFESHSLAAKGEGRIDVFRMLVERAIPVLFRPLKSLLGAYVDYPDKGIILTSQRPLPVQRFTAAHELGHNVLGHKASFDEDDILSRALFEADHGYDVREIQANAFASQLLSPSWLIVMHMKQQGWTRDNLVDPTVVYQLSLRMGSSYSATCYALAESGAIDADECYQLMKIKPKNIKRRLVERFEPRNWYGDVWLVTDRDNGSVLEGSRTDLVVLKLEEHASSGYLWQFGELADAGFIIQDDHHAAGSDELQFGGIVFRTVVAEPADERGARGRIRLRETRPWLMEGAALHSLELSLEFSGPVRPGLLPGQRNAWLGVA